MNVDVETKFFWWKSEFFIHPWENDSESDFWCIRRKFRCYFISLPQSFLFEMTFREFVCVVRWIYVEKSFFLSPPTFVPGWWKQTADGGWKKEFNKTTNFRWESLVQNEIFRLWICSLDEESLFFVLEREQKANRGVEETIVREKTVSHLLNMHVLPALEWSLWKHFANNFSLKRKYYTRKYLTFVVLSCRSIHGF